MQDFIGAVGLLFFIFFVMAAATEAILETIRGLLERFGIKFLKAGISLDDAIRMSTEFLPPGSEAIGKMAALGDAVKKVRNISQEKIAALAALEADIAALGQGTKISDVMTTKINEIAIVVREDLDQNERNRVFLLRIISAGIAILLCYLSNIDAIQSMVQAYPNIFGKIAFYTIAVSDGKTLVTPNGNFVGYAGIILTGIAAASGSSYWHDKLDKVRNLKNAADQLKRLEA